MEDLLTLKLFNRIWRSGKQESKTHSTALEMERRRYQELEEKLRQAQTCNRELVETDRLKAQLMANLSHELRTPMNAILGFSELLLRRSQHQGDPQVALMLESILRNGKHLLALIEDVLDLSKLQAHRLKLRLEGFDLVELAMDAVKEMQALAEQKALVLGVHPACASLDVVNDPIRVRQILINLIGNAIKFTDRGSVDIEVGMLPGDQVSIAVRDTGIGIAPDHQQLIFEEFWQVNQPSIRQRGGTGLGLTIVQSLVQLMQGAIAVESQPGKGTTFRLTFPRQISMESGEIE